MRLESQIEVINDHLAEKLKPQINLMLQKPKSVLKSEVAETDKYALKAFQVAYHMMKTKKTFRGILERFYVHRHIQQIFKSSQLMLRQARNEVLKQETITVTIENEEDFSAPPVTPYIVRSFITGPDNYFQLLEPCKDGGNCKNNQFLADRSCAVALTIFKTSRGDWCLKALANIKKSEKKSFERIFLIFLILFFNARIDDQRGGRRARDRQYHLRIQPDVPPVHRILRRILRHRSD